MCIEDFEENKSYRMPWWDNKAHIIRVANNYTLYHDNGESEVLNFNSAHNFKICTQYVRA